MKKIISCFIILTMILGIRVSAAEELKANVTFNIPNPGHIFFTGEISDIDVGYFNNSAEAMDLSVDIEAQGRKYNKQWSYKKGVSLSAYGSEHETLKIDFAADFGVYDIYDLTITISDGTLSKVITDELSYVKEGVRNDKFGLQVHFLSIDYSSYLDKAIPIAKKAGVGLMRDALDWGNYEKTAGTYKITDEFNKIIDTMNKNNIDPLLILAYGNELYTGTTAHIPSTTTQINAFCNYARQFVADTKDRVKYYEIWNEPNTSGAFNDGDDGTNYGNLVKAVYPVIKKENPNAYVMGYSSTGLNKMTDKAAATGASDYMDAASFHPYPEYSPTVSWATGEQLPEVTNGYIARFVGKTGKQNMWITEQGWSDGAGKNSEALLAAYIVRAYTLAMEGGHVEKYFWNEFIRASLYGDSYEGRFGILQGRTYSTPLAARPTFLSMSNMNSKLAGYDYKESFNSGTIHNCRFENANGEKTYVIWSESGENTSVDLGSKMVLKTDIYGNEELLFSENGVYNINAGVEPAYYEPKQADKFEYSYNASSGICSVLGYIDSKASNIPVSVALFRPGKYNFTESESLTDTYAYFDVITTLTDGVFRTSFSPVYGEGIYLIRLTSKDGEVIEKYLDLRSELTASVDIGNKQLSDVAAGTTLKCNVTVSAENNITKTYDVYIALYEGDKLKNIYLKKDETMENTNSKVTSFRVKENYKISKIRAFAWEKGMIPIADAAQLQ